MLVAVSIVDSNNQPLLMWPVRTDADLVKLNAAAFSSLDVFEETSLMKRGNTSASTISSADSGYLGLLCVMEDFRVYGYASTTNVKFLALIDATGTVKDDVIGKKLKDLHSAYVDAFSNPLIDLPLKSKSPAALNSLRFEKKLQEIVSS